MERENMSVIAEFYSTTIGKKVVMAVTGALLLGFVVMHMLGNLKAFAGIDPATGMYKFDDYAHFLREIGADLAGKMTLLWIARAVLLVAFVLHIVSAIQLARINRLAKPVGTRNQAYSSANAASRSMLFGGLFVLFFVVYHLLHFTFGITHFNGFMDGRVYSNVVLGFQSPLVVLFYLASMCLLSLHLYHGTWSMFQTLGVDSPQWNGPVRAMAKAIAVILFIGFSSVPVAVLTGILQPPTRVAALP
jgi:succinate dehydrogenase / fumarate reductase, cytochrome b subunit